MDTQIEDRRYTKYTKKDTFKSFHYETTDIQFTECQRLREKLEVARGSQHYKGSTPILSVILQERLKGSG